LKKWTNRLLAVFLATLVISGTGSMSGAAALETESIIVAQALGQSDDDGVTNWGFLEPVTHKTTVPAGYTAIRTAQDLSNIRNNLTGKFILMNDINLASWGNWTPIGAYAYNNYNYSECFSGILDGNGYSISNLTVNFVLATTMYAGLFGFTYKSQISNLMIQNCNIRVESTTEDAVVCAGALAGMSLQDCIVYNCVVKGDVYASVTYQYNTGARAGGVVGFFGISSTMEKCVSVGNVYAECAAFNEAEAGGLAGCINSNSLVTDCINEGTTTTLSRRIARAGGIVGMAQSAQVKNCTNKGNVSVPSNSRYGTSAGGIVGVADGTEISCCANWGAVSANSFSTSDVSGVGAGGVAGMSYKTSNCFNAGNVSSSAINNIAVSGGVVALISAGGNVSQCYNVGSLTAMSEQADAYRGGIAGISRTNSTVSNSYYLNNVSVAIGSIDEPCTLNNVMSRSATQLRQQTSFTGFNFTTIWQMPSSGSYLYPVLRDVSIYTVTYNANGGSVSPTSVVVDVGSSLTTPTPTKSYTLSYNVNGGNALSPSSKNMSCTCDGWFTATSGGTKRANAGASYTPSRTETIYAQWTNPTMGTLPTPTHPQGQIFKGWFTAASGGTQVTSNTIMTGSQTIFAQWNEKIYTFGKDTYCFGNYSACTNGSCNGFGHCFGMSSTSSAYYLRLLDIAIAGGSYSQGLYAILSPTSAVKAPICYYQARQGSYALRATVAGGSYYKTDVSNITSDWTEVVNYVKGHAYDDKGTLQIGFRGVQMNGKSGGHAINFLRYSEVGGQPRIYAYDNNFPDGETFFYKDAQGMIRQAPKSTFGLSIDCIALRNVPTYFSAVGGFDATHVIYSDKDAIIVEGVRAYPMDGDVEMGEHVMFEIPAQLSTVTIVPLMDNAAFEYLDNEYSFGKINDDTIGIFTLATSGEGSTQDPSLTITQRSGQTYTVTLNANGGSVSPTSIAVTNGGTYSALPTPTRANCTFDGWYTAASGGSKVNKTDTVNLTGNTTLYAHWTADPQPVKKIFSTKYDATFFNWILFFVCFGWIWMWF